MRTAFNSYAGALLALAALLMVQACKTTTIDLAGGASYELEAGDVAVKRGEYDRALVHYEQLKKYINMSDLPRKEKDEKLALVYQRYAAAKQGKGDLDEALSDVRKAIKLNPYFADAYFFSGLIRHKMGEPDGAMSDYTRAIELNPDYILSYALRGELRTQNGDFDGAIADYSEFIRRNTDYSELYVRRGVLYGLRDEYRKALDDLDRAIQLAPDSGEAYYHRSRIRYLTGDGDGGAADAGRSRALGYTPPE